MFACMRMNLFVVPLSVFALFAGIAGIERARAAEPPAGAADQGPGAPDGISPIPKHGVPGGPLSAAPQADAAPATPAAKEPAPSTIEQRDEILGQLYGHLANSNDEQSSQKIARSIEHLWFYSGSPTTDVLMQRAITALQTNDAELALKMLDAAVELQPDFAEGFHRRAAVYMMRTDPHRAIGDLRRVLALDANHFKALEELGTVLQDFGEKKGALEAYRQLLKAYPLAPGVKESIRELERDVEGQGI
jgi:tetratricopeptide (TPR) repeat protein